MWTRFIFCFIVVKLKINTLVYFFFIFPLSLIQGSPTFLNLRVASWVLSHVRGNQFASLSWDNKLSQSHIIVTDADLCEDADHVEEFSINISNDSTRLHEKKRTDLRLMEVNHVGDPRPVMAGREHKGAVLCNSWNAVLGTGQLSITFIFLMSWTWNFYYKREILSLRLVSLFCTGNDAFSLQYWSGLDWSGFSNRWTN